jgi:hypothetical protein
MLARRGPAPEVEGERQAMKLTDLNPKFSGTNEEGWLRFDCPLGHAHKIRVPVGRYGTARGWEATGVFPHSISLTPSIHAIQAEPNRPTDERDCGWHGFVTNGEILTVS